MASFDLSFPYILSAESFWQLRRSLHQTHRFADNGVPPSTVLTEASLGAGYELSGAIDYFSLAVSDDGVALLVSHAVGSDYAALEHPDASAPEALRHYAVNLITDSETIARFIDWLAQISPAEMVAQNLQSLRQAVVSTQGNVNRSLIRLLLKTLSTRSRRETTSPEFSHSDGSVVPDPYPGSRPSAVLDPPRVALDFPIYSGSPDDCLSADGDRPQQISPPALSLSEVRPRPVADVVRHDQARVDNAKNVFLATVNHELRTPLTYILGMSTTLLRWIDDGSAAALQRQQRHYLESIYNQGKHLLAMINNILDLSQSELGQIALNIRSVSVLRLLRHCIRIHNAEADQRGITITLETQVEPSQDRIAADPLRLQQIVTSLLSNAIKFTAPGGQVVVRLSLSHSEAAIAVQDTGIGIAEHHQTTIFQKFKQVDDAYHRQYAGIGTGLALAKQLTELHHGHIEVDSTPEVGTVFTVRLPCSPDQTGMTPSALGARPSADCLGDRVVLVDDQSEAAAAAADGIIAAGYQLVWMSEGPQMVERIAKLRPCCVIVGACLTDIDSRELMYQLRQNPVCEQLRVVAIDDGRQPAELKAQYHYQALGVTQVLASPIDLTALLDSLNDD